MTDLPSIVRVTSADRGAVVERVLLAVCLGIAMWKVWNDRGGDGGKQAGRSARSAFNILLDGISTQEPRPGLSSRRIP